MSDVCASDLTAGLRDASDAPIEAIGIDRAREAIDAADIVLWLDDAPPPAAAVPIHARADLPGRSTVPPGRLAVSALTGEGVAALWKALAVRAADVLPRLEQTVLNRRPDSESQLLHSTH